MEFSSSGFVTIISIIQGVALGLLAQETFKTPSVISSVLSVTLLLVLIDVFYFYMTLSILLRWAPSFLDAFLPFAIGSLEIPPAFFLHDVAAWTAWLAAFWLFTAGGLFITIRWSPISHFGNDQNAHRMMHRFLWELQMVTGVGGLLAAVVAFFAYELPVGEPWWGMAGAAVVVVTVVLVVVRTEIGSSRIHQHYGVSRPPFN